MKRVLLIIILIFIPSLCLAGTSYYVSPTGTYSWGQCTNINTPCSVTTAEQSASSGDVVYFRGGTYTNETLTPANDGSGIGNEITFIAYSEETPVFDGANTTSLGIDLGGRDHIIIDGFTLRRYTGGYIVSFNAAVASQYLTIQNCTIEQPSNDMVKGMIFRGPVSYIDVLNNTIDMSAGLGVSLGGIVIYGKNGASGQVSHTRVEGNTIIGAGWVGDADAITIHVEDSSPWAQPGDYHLIKDNTIYNWKENCVDLASDAEYIVVTGNTLYDGLTQPITGGGHNRRFYNNKVYGINLNNTQAWFYGGSGDWEDGGTSQIIKNRFWGTGNGLYLQGDNGPRYVYDLYIAHNTFDATKANFGKPGHEAAFHIRSDNNYIENINIRNNIYYYRNGIVGNNLLASVSTSEINSDYNLFYETTNSPGAYVWTVSSSDIPLSDVKNYYNQENNSIEGNPDFTAPGLNDYTLTSESPARNIGSWLARIISASNPGGDTTFTVDDPNWFYDGWTLPGEAGDVIKTENGQSATITSINYSTGQIIVNIPISWTQDEGISLHYEGSKPDIGAWEYDSDISGVYYVNCEDSGSTNVGTYNNPFNSMSTINGYSFSTGDDLYFKVNTTCTLASASDRLQVDWGGTSGNRAIIGCYDGNGDFDCGTVELVDGNRPIIDGNGAYPNVNYGIVDVQDVSIDYITIQDLKLQNTGGTGKGAGVYVAFADNVNTDNCWIYRTRSCIAYAANWGVNDGVDTGIISNNMCAYQGYPEYSGVGAAIEITASARYGVTTNITVTGNHIHNGIYEGIGFYKGVTNCVAEYNIVRDMRSFHLYFGQAKNCTFRYNLVYESSDQASGSFTELEFALASDIESFQDYTYNGDNEIYGNLVAGMSIGVSMGCQIATKCTGVGTPYTQCTGNNRAACHGNTKIYNNTFVDNLHTFRFWGSDDAGDSMEIKNNISYTITGGAVHSDDYSPDGVTWSHNLFDDSVGGNAATNAIIGDPDLSKTSGWRSLSPGLDGTEFDLEETSDAIDEAVSLGGVYDYRIIDTDFTASPITVTISSGGIPRDWSIKDIGAWEYDTFSPVSPENYRGISFTGVKIN